MNCDTDERAEKCFTIMVWKYEETLQIERRWRRWEDNIRMGIKVIG